MTWVRACSTSELADGAAMKVESDPPVALCRVDGEFYAVSDTCSHEEWSLGEDGDLDGHEMICSLHMATFDVRSGQPLCLPATEALRKFNTKVVDNEVFIEMD